MKFPYRRLASGVERPIIPITVRHPLTRESVRYYALVDSGADNCILATEIGELIGLDIPSGKAGTISGVVAGQSRPYYLHDVEIEVGGWWKKTTVGFMPELSKNGHGFVGRHGFFDRFSAIGGAADALNALISLRVLTPMYGPAVRRKKFRRSGFRSCINVSGL